MAYSRSNTLTRNKYYLEGEMRARRAGPFTLLKYRARTYAQGISLHNAKYHGRARDPVEVVNGYVADAVRAGLTGEQIRCALDEAGLAMPAGLMTLGRLLTLDLTQQADTWVRYWANILPRVLIVATRGELDGVTVAGRLYTDKELREVLPLCVTAQAEDLQLWWRLSIWAADLYAEYTRRAEREHKCEARYREICCLYPSDW